MKNIKLAILYTLIILTSISCIKNNDIIFNSASVAEFDAAAYNARSGSLLYPIINRLPTSYGRAINTNLDPIVLNRTVTDTIRLRVNLIGAQRSDSLNINFKVNATFSTATEGVHFSVVGNKTVTIPPNNSFGFVTLVLKNPGAPLVTDPTFVDIVFELLSSSKILSSENYKYVGLRIAQ